MSPPPLNWDAIDRAVATMEQNGLEDVRGHGFGANTAAVDFNHPIPAPWMERRQIDSSVEVGRGEEPPVVDYVVRFPNVQDLPTAPDRDAIDVALTAAAEPFPQGYTIDTQLRMQRAGVDEYSPHIRGQGRPGITIFQFARQVVQAQERFYDRLIG